MNKRQIIELLDKEVGLFGETETEDSLGQLYMTALEFKSAKDVLNSIKRLRKDLDWLIAFYKKKIKNNDKGFYIELTDYQLEDKNITLNGDLILLDPKNVIISNNVISTNKLK